MKIMECPADVKIALNGINGRLEESWSFKRFLVHQLDTFDGVKTRDQVRQAEKIVKKIEASNGTVSLEDADYAVLDDACREIRFVAEARRQLMPFIEALEKKQDA